MKRARRHMPHEEGLGTWGKEGPTRKGKGREGGELLLRSEYSDVLQTDFMFIWNSMSTSDPGQTRRSSTASSTLFTTSLLGAKTHSCSCEVSLHPRPRCARPPAWSTRPRSTRTRGGGISPCPVAPGKCQRSRANSAAGGAPSLFRGRARLHHACVSPLSLALVPIASSLWWLWLTSSSCYGLRFGPWHLPTAIWHCSAVSCHS